MKKIAVFFLLTFTFNLWACPDVNGTFYKCTTGDPVMDAMMGIRKAKLEIEQNGKNIKATFMNATTTIIVDETIENSHYSESRKATINTSASASCQNSILSIEETSRIVYDSGKIENESSVTDIRRSSNKINMNIVQMNENGEELSLDVTCKKK